MATHHVFKLGALHCIESLQCLLIVFLCEYFRIFKHIIVEIVFFTFVFNIGFVYMFLYVFVFVL